MQTEQHRFSQAVRRGIKLGACVALLVIQLSPGLIGTAYAASFKCGKHASASERAVCDDPELSALDDTLAKDYRLALDAALDKPALEADRISQWQWRQHNCNDAVCVKDWYVRRISELEADIHLGKTDPHETFEQSLADQHLPPAKQRVLRNLQDLSGL